MFKRKQKSLLVGLFLATVLAIVFASAQLVVARTNNPVGDYTNGSLLPTGQFITPTAAPGTQFELLKTGLRSDENADAAGAVKTALSPDGKTLLVLTSGYNLNFRKEDGTNITFPVLDPVTGQPVTTPASTRKHEWVFVFDISGGQLTKKQQINIPNTYNGLVWAPDGQSFYVSGGIDDRVYIYQFDGNQFSPSTPFILLGHNSNQTDGFPRYDGGLLKGTPAAIASTGAVVAGLDISQDGKTLVAANFMNDSISVIDTATRKVSKEIKFFVTGGTVATGEYPYDVAIKNDKQGVAVTAYISSQRDDEVLAVDLSTGTRTRIRVGSQPNALLLTPDQRFLFVANGNSDSVSVINTLRNQVVRTLSLARPGEKYKGSSPNSLALSPDGQMLYVTLGGENAVAIVDLNSRQVLGRIPTGWLPNAVSVSPDGGKLIVVNAKDTLGPNPSNGGACPPSGNPANARTTQAGCDRNPTFRNEYTWAQEKAGIAVIPIPDQPTLNQLSRLVNRNNGFQFRNRPEPLMGFLQGKIKNVIYVVKENRTYDQVLGDLPIGNGDPALTVFPYAVSPNHHKLATDFVTLDNFYDSGESSGVGWNWSTYARTTDFTERTQSVLYGNAGFNGLTYDYEGTNRNINMALAQTASSPTQFNVRPTGLLDPSGKSSILPGNKDVNAPSGDGNLGADAIGGYLWDSALRAGKTVRNYGFYIDLAYYDTSSNTLDPTQPDPNNPFFIPITRTPFPNVPQAPVTKSVLLDKTDTYFRGYDQKHPDIYLYEEWLRDMKANGIPNLSLVRLHHDHFGDFAQAVAGVNTAQSQMADNDYAVGLLVETVSKMPEWKETAIFVIEDDAQNGPDHIDGHRSVGYVISPYTKRGALISTNYNTVNLLRTIEDLLGIEHLGINDANAQPMADVFTRRPDFTPYKAIVPGILCKPPVDSTLVPACQDPSATITAAVTPKHNSQWWANATKGFNFKVEDKVDPEAFNRVLWAGIKGEDVPYPTGRSGADLRQNREELLAEGRSGHNYYLAENGA